MDVITLLWSLGSILALVLTVACALVWLIERRDRLSLILCLAGLAAAASVYLELRMMHAATPAEYGHWLRWYILSVYFALGGMLLFVHQYLGTGRLWLMCVIAVMRSLLVVVNFSVQPNFNFLEIISLAHVSLLGEQVSTV